jgi:hypothetical protein
MTMRITRAVLSVAALMWADTAKAQATYTVSVSHHRDVPVLAETEVRNILAKASRMLKKDPSHDDDDMACDVTLTLTGPVQTFSSPIPRKWTTTTYRPCIAWIRMWPGTFTSSSSRRSTSAGADWEVDACFRVPEKPRQNPSPAACCHDR